MKQNPNQRITEYIIKQIEEQNVLPWQRAFETGGMPHNYVSGRNYQGRNLIACLISGYTRPWFMTYAQARKMGGQVRQGEHGIPILYAQNAYKTTDEQSGQVCYHPGTARCYIVFNIAQIDGLEDRVETGDNARIEDFLMRMPVQYERGKCSAWVIGTDKIRIPMRSEFEDENEYYSNILHELVHWSGMSLGRKQPTFEENIKEYSYEELVAELGSCFLRARFGISYVTQSNSQSYINEWLKVLRSDSSILLRASSDAQRAVDWLVRIEAECTQSDAVVAEGGYADAGTTL